MVLASTRYTLNTSIAPNLQYLENAARCSVFGVSGFSWRVPLQSWHLSVLVLSSTCQLIMSIPYAPKPSEGFVGYSYHVPRKTKLHPPNRNQNPGACKAGACTLKCSRATTSTRGSRSWGWNTIASSHLYLGYSRHLMTVICRILIKDRYTATPTI